MDPGLLGVRWGGLVDVYNATGDEHALAEVLDLAADVAGFDGYMISAPDDWLLENDVRYWAGPRSLPLWLPKSEVPLAQRDNSAFHAAGGVLSDLRQTLLRTFEDEQQRGLSRVRRSGLARHEELELLSSAQASSLDHPTERTPWNSTTSLKH